MTDRLAKTLDILRAHADELRRRGVLHAAVFGSVARGEDTPESDVDILVELDPEANVSLIGYSGLRRDIEEWIGSPVDIADVRGLRPRVRPRVESEAVNAF